MKYINIIHERGAIASPFPWVAAALFTVLFSGFVQASLARQNRAGGEMEAAATTVSDEVRYLVIWNADNSYTAFALEEHPKITYDTAGGMVTCVTTRQEVSFSLKDVRKYTFESTSAPGNSLETLPDAAGSFGYAAAGLFFSGFASGSTVEVYSADGSRVANSRIGADGTLSVPTGDWTPGVYIIKT